jgi:hypothetical protein
MNFQVVFAWIEQIFNPLVVDFAHRYLNTKFHIFIGCLDPIEDSPDHAGNDTLHLHVVYAGTLHRVGLTRGRLTIREDCTVEAIEHGVDNRSRSMIVYLTLLTICVEYPIKLKLVDSMSAGGLTSHVNLYVFLILVEVQAALRALGDLLLVQRSHPADNHHIS